MTHKIDVLVMGGLARLHTLLVAHGFYPVAISTGLCLSLFAFRAYLSRTWTFSFLLWNLFLAWLPYLCSLLAVTLHRRYPRRWWLLPFPVLISIALFPNAPYIITDFVHLTERLPVPLWYDIGMLAGFAWTGIVLGSYALRILQNILRAGVGTLLSRVFALGVLGCSGMGIYMGRFLRWNSWDLVTQPRAVLYDIAIRLRHPLGNKETYGVTLLYAALMFIFYLALTAGPVSSPHEERNASL
jgi:uncharacterized membrane protein